MKEIQRVDCFFERHIGFGIRWDEFVYPLHISISIPFVTFTIGFGSYSNDN